MLLNFQSCPTTTRAIAGNSWNNRSETVDRLGAINYAADQRNCVSRTALISRPSQPAGRGHATPVRRFNYRKRTTGEYNATNGGARSRISYYASAIIKSRSGRKRPQAGAVEFDHVRFVGLEISVTVPRIDMGGLEVQWLGHRTCDQQVASSTPGVTQSC